MRRLLLALLLVAAAPAGAASRYNWDDLAAEFCRLTLAGDLPALRPLLTASLAADIQAAAANPNLPPARVLFQTYTNEVPLCEVATRNAAVVEIRRGRPAGAAPSWTEYLVIAPEPDGGTRIDDVLFATSRSDTLRARLAYYAATR